MTIDDWIKHAREISLIERNNQKLNNTLGKSSPYYYQDCIKRAEEHEQLAEWLEQLKEYKQLEEQGRLVKLPCKVGDWIFIVKRYGLEEANITGISEADDISCFCFKVYIDPDCDEIVALEDFNETWFLTKSEAEAKLKELRGGENGR